MSSISRESSGWDTFYPSLFPKINNPLELAALEQSPLPHYAKFIAKLRKEKIRSVWISGCAHSLLPHALNCSGFDVFATDIDDSALLLQKQFDTLSLKKRMDILGLTSQTGSLNIAKCDLGDKLCVECIDLSIAFVNLANIPTETIRKFAISQFESLQNSSVLIYDASSFGFAKKVLLERYLSAAGFWVPYDIVDIWCEDALQETNIKYDFVLGSPTVLRQGMYENNRSIWEKDYLTIVDIADRYKAKLLEVEKKLARSTFSNKKLSMVLNQLG